MESELKNQKSISASRGKSQVIGLIIINRITTIEKISKMVIQLDALKSHKVDLGTFIC